MGFLQENRTTGKPNKVTDKKSACFQDFPKKNNSIEVQKYRLPIISPLYHLNTICIPHVTNIHHIFDRGRRLHRRGKPKVSLSETDLEMVISPHRCKCLPDGESQTLAISGTDSLEVPTIYKAYFLGLCKGISPENMALYGTVPPF